VIGPTGAVRVMIATKPVDFRKGAEGLAVLVRETMAADPFSGAVYVFRAKRADRIKLVFWDGTGFCLFRVPRCTRSGRALSRSRAPTDSSQD
jgi:transposase